jgi:hypothetical protein
VGRGFVIWFLCLVALLVGFLGAQVNPLVYLVAGVLAPLPVLIIGWRSGEWAALAVALAGAFGCGVNDLPLSMIISWYEQKACAILLMPTS